MRRKPAVAGQFYYSSAEKLKEQVEQYIVKGIKKQKAIGAVSPHAGLIYSGHVAGAVFSEIEFPETFVLLGPNHTGIGPQISIMEEGQWEIPTGSFTIDKVLAYKIYKNSSVIIKDNSAHMFEHSLEVQLPFIAYFSDKVKIVPISILMATAEKCKILGEEIANAIKSAGYPVMIIASSDMSHYVPENLARKKDEKAISKILSLDPGGLYNTILIEKISMCGYLPVTVMLYAAKALGAQSAKLVKYATSGEISGDYEQVVGYAGIIIR